MTASNHPLRYIVQCKVFRNTTGFIYLMLCNSLAMFKKKQTPECVWGKQHNPGKSLSRHHQWTEADEIILVMYAVTCMMYKNMCVNVCVRPSVCLYVSISVYLPNYLPACLSVFLSVTLPVCSFPRYSSLLYHGQGDRSVDRYTSPICINQE